MLKSACLISAAALVLILLSGCVTAVGSILSAGASGVGAYFDYKASKASEPVIVVPEIDQYSPAVQRRMADELQAMAPPCPRDAEEVQQDCSVTARMIMDYGDLRNRIRAAADK